MQEEELTKIKCVPFKRIWLYLVVLMPFLGIVVFHLGRALGSLIRLHLIA